MTTELPQSESNIEPFETTVSEAWLPEGIRTMMGVQAGSSRPLIARVCGRRSTGSTQPMTLEGELRMFDPDGVLFGVAHYESGRAHGETKFFFVDGTLRSRRVYEHGRPHGFFENFNEDGTPKSLNVYRDGTAIGGLLTFHPDGQPASFRPGIPGRPVGGDLRRWDREGNRIGGTAGADDATDLVFDRDETGRVVSVSVRVRSGHLVIQRPGTDDEFIALIPNDNDGELPVTLPAHDAGTR